MTDIKDKGTEKHSFSISEEIFDIFECFVFSLIIVFVLFSFMTRVCIVDGQSMENTLYNNEKLVVSNIGGKPDRGDIIVFHETGDYFNEPLVKRVIATEGQWIDIRNDIVSGRLIVTVYDNNMENPTVLEENYAKYADVFVRIAEKNYPVQVPEGHVFVMGDNRNHSTDSRSNMVGFVDSRRILGTVFVRLTPLSKFGAVD